MSRTGGKTIAVSLGLVALLAALGPGELAAQAEAEDAPGDEGLELELEGLGTGLRGRPVLARGRVFRVRGLANLDALPEATVEARIDGQKVAETRAGAGGAFVLPVPIPPSAEPVLGVELVVRHGTLERTYEQRVAVQSPLDLYATTDRRHYRPGERVHAWALVRDRHSLAPVAGRTVTLQLDLPDGTTAEHAVTTGAAGVAHHVFTLPPGSGDGAVRFAVDGLSRQVALDVGRRTQERLLLTLDWPETHVRPSETFHPEVRVVAPSGEPARDAAITLTVEGMEPVTGRTDLAGRWTGEAPAPAYLARESGAVTVNVVVTHPAIGTARTQRTLTLSTTGRYSVSAFTAGALPLGMEGEVFFAVHDPAGNRAPGGVTLVVRSAALRGGRAEVTTDANGLAVLPVRVEALHTVPDQCGELGLLLAVDEGERHHALCVPAAEADLTLRVQEAVVTPGGSITVRVTRHLRIARRPVILELGGEGNDLLAVHRVEGDRITLTVPPVVGTLRLRGYALLDEDRSLGGRSGAAHAAVLVRPEQPRVPSAEPTQTTYAVGEAATVQIDTGADPGWLAVDVRDLAQHGGERPFSLSRLRGRFERAVLDPTTPDADRLIRAVLAVLVAGPIAPREAVPADWSTPEGLRTSTRGDQGPLLDPILEARLAARQMGAEGIRLVEAALRELGADALATGEGAARRFDVAAVDALLADSGQQTLGERPLRLAHLREADPLFGFPLAARRLARERLVAALQRLVQGIDDGAIDGSRPERWVSEMVRHAALDPDDMADPWGHPLGVSRRPEGVLAPSLEATGYTLAFPGPDGRLGTSDDIVDPFARVVPAGTLYAEVSGEEALLRALSLIVPVDATMQGWVAVLERVTAAMQATLIGDAARAEAIGDSLGFGGLGLVGHGAGGGGSGSGYGRGALGSRGRRAPRVRTGAAGILDELGSRVRQDFPGTLLFVPAMPTGDGGLTTLTIPLADAATSYLVEVVHWRLDGWSASTSTRFATAKPLVVEAPLPPLARVGEVLRIPVRARSRNAVRAEVGLVAEGDLDVVIGPTRTVDVPAGGAAVGFVEVEVRGPGSGSLVAVVRGGEDDDAIRMPFRALRDVRRVTREEDRLLVGTTVLTFGATAREPEAWALEPSRVTLSSAEALFAGESSPWVAWAAALAGEPRPVAPGAISLGGDLTRAAAEWANRSDDDGDRRLLMDASTALDQRRESPIARALTLLALAPAWAARDARPALSDDLGRLRDALLERVEAEATESSDDHALHAVAAAALAAHDRAALAAELVRRARRGLIRFGEDVWLPGGGSLGSRGASAALGLADRMLGDTEEAFALLRTMAARRSEEPAVHGGLRPDDEGLAQALARRLTGAPLTEVEVVLGERTRTLRFVDGRATFTALLRRGRGQVPVTVPADQVVVARVTSELALPWPAEAHAGGPLRVTRVGDETVALDGHGTTTLVVRNAVPRSLREPVLTVSLPAGAVLDARSRAELDARLAAPVGVEDGRLRLRLRPLVPGRSVELPITLRYEVAGELRGFGVDAFVADREDRRTVVPPRAVTVNGGDPR